MAARTDGAEGDAPRQGGAARAAVPRGAAAGPFRPGFWRCPLARSLAHGEGGVRPARPRGRRGGDGVPLACRLLHVRHARGELEPRTPHQQRERRPLDRLRGRGQRRPGVQARDDRRELHQQDGHDGETDGRVQALRQREGPARARRPAEQDGQVAARQDSGVAAEVPARRRAPRARRGRGAAVGPGPRAARLPGHRRRQRVHGRLGRDRRRLGAVVVHQPGAGSAPSSCTSPGAAFAQRARRPVRGGAPASSAPSTPAARSTRPSSLAWPARWRAGRRSSCWRRAGPSGARGPCMPACSTACSRWSCAAAPACPSATSGRCARRRARRCSRSASPTAASAGRWKWCCGRTSRLADPRGGSPVPAAGRPLEGRRDGARDGARDPRHGGGVVMTDRHWTARPAGGSLAAMAPAGGSLAAIAPPAGAALAIIAKAPVAGQVKTRLCPPFARWRPLRSPRRRCGTRSPRCVVAPAARRVVVLDGPPGPWRSPGSRCSRSAARPGGATRARVRGPRRPGPGGRHGHAAGDAGAALVRAGRARTRRRRAGPRPRGDWAIGLRRPDARAFAGVPMSAADTGRRGRAAGCARSGSGWRGSRRCATSTAPTTSAPSPAWRRAPGSRPARSASGRDVRGRRSGARRRARP